MASQDKWKRLKRSAILLVFALLCLSGCKDYSTDDLLNLKFSTGGTKGLKISSPSPIAIGQPFTITVTATNTVMPNGIQKDYKDNLNLTLQVGGGTLSSVTGGGWNSGTQNFTVVYDNPSLSLNSTEVILLKATDATDPNTSGYSNNITAICQKQFKITVPDVTFKGQPFTATITAANADNSTNTGYNGTVNLSTYLQVGTVSPATVTGFVNGVATVSLTISQSFTNLQLKAVDSVSSLLSGFSNIFQVYYDYVSLSVFATPALPNSLRLEYTYPTGTNTALIYRDSGSGLQLLATQNSPTNFYTDTGLGAQNYTYQVIVQNAPGTVQYSATKTAMPGACGTIVSGAVSGSWTATGNPYCMTGNTTVSGTLTIAAGTVILVNPTFLFTIQSGGTLITQGTSTDPVVFTSANTAPAAGDWKGISFATGAIGSTIASDNYVSGSIIDGTRISFAGPGVATSESLYIANSTIQNNRSPVAGGGISANISAGKQLVIKNSLILNNTTTPPGTASLYGGGVYSTERTAIYSSRISGNTASSFNVNVLLGGGLYIAGSNSLLISSQVQQNNITISGSNNCCLYGGGAYFAGDNNTITGNTFRGNTIGISSGGGSGAGLSVAGSGSTISNNIIDLNTLPSSANKTGGGVSITGNLNTFTRNTVTNNTAISGLSPLPQAGGMDSGGNTITFNEIQGNTASGCGGAMILSNAATVTNNNIYSNSSNCFAAAIAINSIGAFNLTANYWGGPTSGLTTMGICDSSNGCSGTATITGAVSTPYPLCKTAPLNPSCVGANF